MIKRYKVEDEQKRNFSHLVWIKYASNWIGGHTHGHIKIPGETQIYLIKDIEFRLGKNGEGKDEEYSIEIREDKNDLEKIEKTRLSLEKIAKGIKLVEVNK